jgi:hypothetical protein
MGQRISRLCAGSPHELARSFSTSATALLLIYFLTSVVRLGTLLPERLRASAAPFFSSTSRWKTLPFF